MWWKRKLDLQGEAFFRGTLAPTLESLQGLAEVGVEVEVVNPAGQEVWAANLRHRHWGTGRLSARRGAVLPPEIVIRLASGLTDSERKTILNEAQSVLRLEVASQTGDVLRDRKQFLRFLGAVLGRDGVAGMDLLGQTYWTPGRLSDELRHDAALDIIHVHVLHVVEHPGGVWLHSHGLAQMGFVDFDVLRPAQDLLQNQFDLLRSIAFQIVEGASSGMIEPAVGADPVELVDAPTFMRSASESDRALRDPEGHSDNRVVCCDSKSGGLLSRLFGAKGLRPSRLLSQGMVEGQHLIRFSDLSTDLTAARARDSLSLLEPFRSEFADLQCVALVKMRYAPDSRSDGSEHLWFEVHRVNGDRVDATLVNDPFDIASMKAGQRAHHDVDRLTDWTLLTPLGQLTPRTLEVARKLREERPRILESLRSRQKGSDPPVGA